MRVLCLLEDLPTQAIQAVVVATNSLGISQATCRDSSEVEEALAKSIPDVFVANLSCKEGIRKFRARSQAGYVVGILGQPFRKLRDYSSGDLDVDALIACEEHFFDFHQLVALFQNLATKADVGLQHYLFGCPIRVCSQVTNHESKESALQQVREFVTDMGLGLRSQKFQWFANNLSMVCDEMLLAALTYTLRQSGGSLSGNYELGEKQAVTCEFIFDGRLIVRVQDQIGALTRSEFVNILSYKGKTSIDEDPAGTWPWIGLRFAYEHSDLMVINVDSGKSTEFVTMLSIDGFPSLRKNRVRSVHFFSR